MYDKIVKIISQYEEKGDFTHPNVDDKDLYDAEKILNLKSYAASDVWNEEDTLKWMWNIPTLSNLGNEELLAHIKNCEFVMTDSFHGVCFAIIFNKPFHKQILKISVLQSSKTSKGVCKRAFNMASCLLKIKPTIIKRIIP